MSQDNHVDASGVIRAAVERVREKWAGEVKMDVECRSLEDVREALKLEVETIMLDNMDVDECAGAIALREREFAASKTKFEASGDMDHNKLSRFARLGLDFISVGKLTHSVAAGNFSMRIER